MKQSACLLIFFLLVCCTRSGNEIIHESNLPEHSTITLQPVSITDAAGDTYFTGFRKLLLTSENHVIINDYGHQAFFHFDVNGDFLGQIGQRGRGPGEFMDIWDFLITHGDTLHIFDRNNSRHQVIAQQNGEWIQSRENGLRLTQSEEIHSFFPSAIMDQKDGKYLALFRNNIGLRDTTTMYYNWLQWVDMDLQAIDQNKLLFTPVESVVTIRDNRSVIVNSHPNSYKLFTQFDKQGQLLHQVQNTDGKIRVFTPEGSEIDEIQLPLELVPHDADQRQEYFNRISQIHGRAALETAEDLYFEHQPFIKQFILDDTGNYWVQISRKNSTHPDWIIVDPEGHITGSFRIEDTFDSWQYFRLEAVMNGRMFGLVYAEEVPLFVVIDTSFNL